MLQVMQRVTCRWHSNSKRLPLHYHLILVHLPQGLVTSLHLGGADLDDEGGDELNGSLDFSQGVIGLLHIGILDRGGVGGNENGQGKGRDVMAVHVSHLSAFEHFVERRSAG